MIQYDSVTDTHCNYKDIIIQFPGPHNNQITNVKKSNHY